MRRLITAVQLGMAASLSAQRAQLLDKLKGTPAGASIAQEFALRAEGKGSPHRASLKRIFDEEKPEKEVKDTKWTSRNEEKNKVFFNYGTMLDFFDYSGVVVQNSIRYADLVQPKYHGYSMLP